MSRMLVGLIGANIMRSMSPALFAEAFAATGIDGFYHLMDVDQLPGRSLPQLFNSIKAVGFCEFNVTYPFKQAIIPLLDTVDAEADQIGAINTVLIEPDGRTSGYNFDRGGFRRSIELSFGRASTEGATVVQVGAGGAGRAVAFALTDLGVATLVVHDLDRARADALVADVCRHCGASRARVAGGLAGEVAAADGVVNATQTGMRGFPGNPVPAAALKPTHWAADVIYTPPATEFLQAAAARGARVLNGAGMCTHQAVAAFGLFTGLDVDAARLARVFEAGYTGADPTASH